MVTAMSGDEALTVAQAAKILERQPRQVREWAKNGRLKVVGDSPLKVSKRSVMALKETVKARKRRSGSSPSMVITTSDLAEVLAQQFELGAREGRKALETLEAVTARNDDNLRREIAERDARIAELEKQLGTQPKRGWFGR
jgi:hypothetical protein